MSDALARTDWTHEHATVNGVRLHYVAAGPADGPLVVLLHGFPEFWYSWRRQIPALADAGYRVAAVDLRGYNVSEKPRGVSAYRVAELAADVAGLVDALADGGAHVVGHDWGGTVAWKTVARHPRTVDSLVVMNAPHPGPLLRELKKPDQARRMWYTLVFQLPWYPEALFRARDFALVERMFRDGSVRPNAFDDLDIQRYKRALARPGALTSAVNYYRALGRGTVHEAVLGDGAARDATLSRTRIDQPTLVLWGLDDPALSPRLLDGMDRWTPNVRVQRLIDTSHWVQADAPGEVNAHCLEFLDGVANR